MNRLIILGNGFDIAHDFKSNWKDIFEDEDIFKINNKTNVLSYIEKDLWSDFEKGLGDMVLSYYSFFKETDKKFNFLQKNEIKKIHLQLNNFCSKVCNEIKKLYPYIEPKNIKDEKIEEILNKVDMQHFKDHIFKDRSREIKRIMINEIIQRLQKFKFNNKYSSIFNKDSDYVINYNYTTFSEEDGGYFKKDNVHHIHGFIRKEWIEMPTIDNYGMIHSGILDDVALGLYEMSAGIGTDVDKKVCNIDDTIYSNIKEYVGLTEMFFWKEIDRKKLKKFLEKANSFNEIIIFGHSLSGNDLPYIINYINLSKIHLIKYICYWESDKNDNEMIKENDNKVKKIFNGIEKIEIINSKNLINELKM